MNIIKKIKFGIMVSMLPLLMSGCIATKSYDFRPSTDKLANKIDVTNQLPYRVVKVSTQFAPKEQMEDVNAIPNMLIENMRNELDTAIVSSGIFDLNAENNDITIKTIIYRVETPLMSITFPADMKAEYIVYKSDEVIYRRIITSKAHTESSFSFLGGTRQMESINRVVQNNIINFLADIQRTLK